MEKGVWAGLPSRTSGLKQTAVTPLVNGDEPADGQVIGKIKKSTENFKQEKKRFRKTTLVIV